MREIQLRLHIISMGRYASQTRKEWWIMTSQDNPLMKNPELQQCFDSLPPYMQENIKQSGVQFKCAQDMKEYAEHMDCTQK